MRSSTIWLVSSLSAWFAIAEGTVTAHLFERLSSSLVGVYMCYLLQSPCSPEVSTHAATTSCWQEHEQRTMYYECSEDLSSNLASIIIGVTGHSRKISCFSSTIHMDF